MAQAAYKPKFSVYFSHSWRSEDVDLNQLVWKEISHSCNLLVDQNQQTTPPYYINKLEEYMRRSDLFLAVLPLRVPKADEEVDLRALDCPPGGLFEVRLAERARKPRLILFDAQTKFSVPAHRAPLVQYESFSAYDVLNGRGGYINEAIRTWMNEVRKEATPKFHGPNQRALVLLPRSKNRQTVFMTLKKALNDAGYVEVSALEDSWTDIQVLNRVFESSLLVADLAEGMVWDIYAMAHAVFVPTIRLLRRNSGPSDQELPWLLRGYAKGYQDDIVRWKDLKGLAEAVQERAKAMRDTRKVITTWEEGHQYFERRRFMQDHRVFISHDLKGKDRPIIEAIVKALQQKAVSCWEYQDSNRSADNWPQKMEEELHKATHSIVIAGPEYEQSDACEKELQTLLRSKRRPVLFPYLWGERTRPIVALNRRKLHHEHLSAIPDEAAAQIVGKILATLT